MRIGWAKAFVDGALGSRTAAVFEPYTCGPPGPDRHPAPVTRRARRADRRGPGGADRSGHPCHRRPWRCGRAGCLRTSRRPAARKRPRTESSTCSWCGPPTCPGSQRATSRPACSRCTAPPTGRWWRRAGPIVWPDAYPVAALRAAGARLAFGSDAPIESPNPWTGIFAAVHRRFPRDGTPDWQAQQAIGVEAALSAYTLGPRSRPASPMRAICGRALTPTWRC